MGAGATGAEVGRPPQNRTDGAARGMNVFWWRKRNEGFEWRDYVRTTILVRREQRRQKLKDVQAAASAHVKDAGKRGVDAGIAGARVAGTGAKTFAKGTWGFSKVAAHALGAWSAKGAQSTGSALAWLVGKLWDGARALIARIAAPLAPRAEPILDFARQPRINLALKIVAGAAALGAAYRAWAFGFDADAVVATILAAGAAALVGLAFLTDPYRQRQSDARESLLARLRETDFELPGTGRISATTAGLAVLGVVAIATVVGTAAYYGLPNWNSGQSHSTSAPRTADTGETQADLEGRATAISGDMLRIAGALVTLDGIEAPEAGQSCKRQDRKWQCGAAAKDALANLVRGRRISCDIVHEDDAEKRVRCYARGKDIAEQLVRSGHVFSKGGFLSAYAGFESDAQAEKLGLWAGDIERPQDYRDKRWEEAKRSAPEGCPIKGRIQSGARTYILPWSPAYESVRLRTSRGERWFCSESEAQAAGWSRASPS